MQPMPDKMNFQVGLYNAAKKLKNPKEQGEFLMAALTLYFEGIEPELSGNPDLLFDGWHDRILASRDAADNGRKSQDSKTPAKGGTQAPAQAPAKGGTQAPAQAPAKGGTQAPAKGGTQAPAKGGVGYPRESIEYRDMSIENKEKELLSQLPKETPTDNNGGALLPDFVAIINPKESPYVSNPPDYDFLLTYAQTNIPGKIEPDWVQGFLDYYAGVGWVTGKNQTPMRDWRPFLKSWIERERKYQTEQQIGSAEEVDFGEIVERALERHGQASESIC